LLLNIACFASKVQLNNIF